MLRKIPILKMLTFARWILNPLNAILGKIAILDVSNMYSQWIKKCFFPLENLPSELEREKKGLGNRIGELERQIM